MFAAFAEYSKHRNVPSHCHPPHENAKCRQLSMKPSAPVRSSAKGKRAMGLTGHVDLGTTALLGIVGLLVGLLYISGNNQK